MKLDTSSYYPKSPLDDDPQEEIHEVSEVSESHGIPEGHENREIAGDTEPAEPPGPVGQAVTNISHLLSWLLVPLMMPVYGTLLAFGLSILAFTGMGVRIAFVGVVFAFNVLIPSLAVIILKRMPPMRDGPSLAKFQMSAVCHPCSSTMHSWPFRVLKTIFLKA